MEIFKLFGTIAIQNEEARRAIEDTKNEAKSAGKAIGDALEEDIEIDSRSAVSSIESTEKRASSGGKNIDKALEADVDIDTKEAKKNLDDVVDKSEETESRLSEAFKKIGAAVATAFAIDKIKDFGITCNNAASDSEALASQFTQVFGGVEGQAASDLSAIAESTGIVENRMKGSYTQIAAFAKTSGMDSADSLALANRAMVAVADSAAFYDRTLEDTTESLQSFLKGNYANDAALGISCTETTRNAAANKLYGQSFQDLSESQKQLTLLQMVEDANELSGAMGQASRESDTWTNQTGNLQQAWTDFKALIGSNFLDTAVTVVKKLSDAVVGMGEKFREAKEWLEQHETTVVAVTTVVTALASAFIAFAAALKIKALISALPAAITVVKTALAGLNATMLANPIGLIIAGITALIAIFAVLWNNCEPFREFWINLWENIKEVAGAAIEGITGFFSALWEKIQPVVETIKSLIDAALSEVSEMFDAAWGAIQAVWNLVKPYFTAIWEAIKAVFSVVKNILGGYFKSAWDNIKLCWSVVVQYFKLIWENIKVIFSVVAEVLGGFFSTAWDIIKNVWDVVVGFFKLIWDNIKLIFSVVEDVLTGNFKEAWEGIKQIWNNVSAYFQSVWNAIKNIFTSVKSFFQNAFSSAWNAIKSVFSNVGDFFEGLWDTIKSKFTSIGTIVAEAIGGAFKSAVNAVISTVEGAINLIPNAVNGAINLINELPGVSIGTIPTVSLPRLAKGGVVNTPTIAEIGEDGAEAVVPLERNTEWINRVSDRLVSRINPKLMRYVSSPSISSSDTGSRTLIYKIDILISMLAEYFPEIIESLNRPIVLSTGETVGALAPYMDEALGDIYSNKERGG